ncbi:MAG: hypothetical protein AAF253_07095 [Pseudomonadota bacterium]
MPRFTPIMIAALTGLALASPLASPADAKEYNQTGSIPSDAQAMINRIQADIAVMGDDEGFYGSFEDDCSSLNIGANADGSAPDQQVIVADTIVNIGGRCRVVRGQAGFQNRSGETPSDTYTPPPADPNEIPFD